MAILTDQHLRKGVLDDLIKAIDERMSSRTAQIAQIEAEIEQLQSEVAGWEQKEKERVAFGLEDSCQEQKKQFEAQNKN